MLAFLPSTQTPTGRAALRSTMRWSVRLILAMALTWVTHPTAWFGLAGNLALVVAGVAAALMVLPTPRQTRPTDRRADWRGALIAFGISLILAIAFPASATLPVAIGGVLFLGGAVALFAGGRAALRIYPAYAVLVAAALPWPILLLVSVGVLYATIRWRRSRGINMDRLAYRRPPALELSLATVLIAAFALAYPTLLRMFA